MIEVLQSYDIWKAHADEANNSRTNLDDFSPADRSRTFALTKDFPNSEDDEEEEDDDEEEREEWPENNGITNGIEMYYT